MKKLLVENIAYIWLSGIQTPDFRTINIFRSKRLAGTFDRIFTQIVLMLNEEGLYHRSMRLIEPEAVFGDIKFNHGFKRFKLKSNAKVSVEFGLVALAHNLRKYIALGAPQRNLAHKKQEADPF